MTGRTEDVERKTAHLTRADDWSHVEGHAASLVVLHRDGADVALLAQDRRLTVGRTVPADIVVPDAALSRQHACFFIKDQSVWVEDLDSTNGTFVDGQRIDAPVKLDPGATAVLGAVQVVVQPLPRHPTLGLDSHDQMVQALEREIDRARHFNREASLMMVSAGDGSHVGKWLEQVQSAVRPIDRLALYSPSAIEVLLVELSQEEAARLAAPLVEHGLRVAIGTFPGCATSAEGLSEACRTALRRATSTEPLERVPLSRAVVFEGAQTSDLVAESEVMKEVLGVAKRLARGTIPVLLHGETGTGKEVISRYIHDHGVRSDGPMVAVNCAAIPPQLVESTLFGHVKGAFTGATQAGTGVFEAANGGTVLLDEIGELPAAAQSALLRVLETKKVTRVGSTKEIEVDARIMAATHRDLEAMSTEGTFRQDLYYRLNALTLELPALRERREDIALLAARSLAEANATNRRSISGISPEALGALEAYPWPGNVRELRNVIERAVVIADDDVITLADLPQRLRSRYDTMPPPEVAAEPKKSATANSSHRRAEESFRECIERIETDLILEALEKASGNQSETARILNMPRRTLINKMTGLGIKKRGYGVE